MKTGYKLFRLRKDGTLGSLFIDARRRLSTGEWMEAECHPRKGYAVRPFWHCCSEPVAPHLSTAGRVWRRVLMRSATEMQRPESQGGKWFLAGSIKILPGEVE